jgi:hypothetical protein
MDAPKHPKAAKYISFLAGVRSFKELEARIASLPAEDGIGDAFEVWVEGYLVRQEGIDAATLWPTTKRVPALTCLAEREILNS